MFSKIGAFKNFAIFTGKHMCWPLQAFFYRPPIVTASRFSRQQIHFIRWIWYLLLTVTPVFAPNSFKNTTSKPQKQPLELFCKKVVLRNFANFTGKHLCWSFFLIELPEVCSFIKKRLRQRCFPEEFAFLMNLQNFQEHLIWRLWTIACETCSFICARVFSNSHFWHKFIHML